MSLSRFSGQYRAVDFNYGGPADDAPAPLTVVAGPGVSGAGTLTVQNGFVTLSDGTKVSPLATTASISVINALGKDTVTPSAVTNNLQSNLYGLTSSVTATFTYAHSAGDRICSGTAGLQEAINYANSKGGGTVIVDNAWATAGGTAAILNAATLPSNGTVQILDNRGGQGAPLQTLTLTIPNASVLTLSSVGYPLIPAPGAGNLIQVERLWLEQIAATAAFASGGVITAAYGTQAAQTACTASIAATVLTGGSGTTNQIGTALPVSPANGNSSALLNKAVGLYAATGDFTTGGGTLLVKISYRILTGF